MKVYLFDEKSGLYEGEDYWSNDEISTEAGATTVAPPIARSGQVPVYDKAIGSWKMVSPDRLRKVVNRNV